MKLLYLPLIYYGQNNEQKYLERSLRKFFNVQVFDYCNTTDPNNALKKIVEDFEPDVIHCQFQGTNIIDVSVLKEIRMKHNCIISQWTGDEREEPIPEYVKYGDYCDLNLVVSLEAIRQYMSAGLKNVKYWQNAIAIPEQIGHPPDEPKNIVFCGSRYTTFPNSKNRIELIERFKKEFGDQFKVYGFGWPFTEGNLPWGKQTEVYQSAFLTLGQNNVADHEWWFSDRQLIAMAAGRPHLCQYSNNLEALFDNGKECIFYKSIDEAVKMAKWILGQKEIAEYIGKKGQEKVKAIYNWDYRVEQFIKMILEVKK